MAKASKLCKCKEQAWDELDRKALSRAATAAVEILDHPSWGQFNRAFQKWVRGKASALKRANEELTSKYVATRPSAEWVDEFFDIIMLAHKLATAKAEFFSMVSEYLKMGESDRDLEVRTHSHTFSGLELNTSWLLKRIHELLESNQKAVLTLLYPCPKQSGVTVVMMDILAGAGGPDSLDLGAALSGMGARGNQRSRTPQPAGFGS